MTDPFLTREWELLCERLRKTARYCAETASADTVANMEKEIETFVKREPPTRYPDLLTVTREAAELASKWRQAV